MQKFFAKAAASALAAGAAGYSVPASSSLKAPFAIISALCGLLLYARVWIQGYWFDRRYWRKVDLSGRVALVTGGTVGGLGFAAASILAQMSAIVIVTVRSKAKGEAAVAALGEGASYILCDFTSTASIKAAAAELSSMGVRRLDLLVLNAGISGDKNAPGNVWMANQVGPFLFTERLRPLLEATADEYGDVRVVAVSSGAHKRAFINYDDPWVAGGGVMTLGASPYGQSKLAQIMHMRELQRRVGLGGRFRCFAITPGFALTNIMKPPKPLLPLAWLLARSAHVGAMPIKMACVESELPGGSYISNCYVKASEGKDGASNEPGEWEKLWALCEKSVEEAAVRYP